MQALWVPKYFLHRQAATEKILKTDASAEISNELQLLEEKFIEFSEELKILEI